MFWCSHKLSFSCYFWYFSVVFFFFCYFCGVAPAQQPRQIYRNAQSELNCVCHYRSDQTTAACWISRVPPRERERECSCSCILRVYKENTNFHVVAGLLLAHFHVGTAAWRSLLWLTSGLQIYVRRILGEVDEDVYIEELYIGKCATALLMRRRIRCCSWCCCYFRCCSSLKFFHVKWIIGQSKSHNYFLMESKIVRIKWLFSVSKCWNVFVKKVRVL
jgi:hypothetical protein